MFALQALAQAAAPLTAHSLSPLVRHHAQRAVVDWYASVFPGLAVDPVPTLHQVLADDLDHGPARLVLGRQATARAAALLHGTAAHAAEVDDSFRDAMYHPGAATIAAALAASQQAGTSGLGFLHGVVLGYELSTRIGVVLGRAHYRHWHNTGTVGTLGAAAAAATVLGLPASGLAHALATAATFAAGLQQAFRQEAMSKPLHAGRAAEAGLLAAQLAARGVTGSLDMLDGAGGLGQAMSDGPDWSTVADTLGQDFHITRLTFKNHIGCGHTFAAIDAALALRTQHGLRPEDIARVTVATYGPALAIANQTGAATAGEARFSFPYVVATALTQGRVRLSAYDAAARQDPQTLALMPRVQVQVDPALDAAFPRQRAARVDIHTHDGRCLSHHQPNRKGDPEDPLSDADLADKLLELASPVIGTPRAQALLEQIWRLDTASGLPQA